MKGLPSCFLFFEKDYSIKTYLIEGDYVPLCQLIF